MEAVPMLFLLGFDALAAKRGEGLHPILRERLLGVPSIDAPRKPTTMAGSPKNRNAKKENAPTVEQERSRFRVIRGG
jgi:hypothetical protein